MEWNLAFIWIFMGMKFNEREMEWKALPLEAPNNWWNQLKGVEGRCPPSLRSFFSSLIPLFFAAADSSPRKKDGMKREKQTHFTSSKTFHSMKDKKLSSLSFHSHLAFVGLVLGSLPLCGAMAAAAALNPPKSINPNQPTQFTFTPFNLSFSICLVSSANGKKVKRWAPFIDFHFILV